MMPARGWNLRGLGNHRIGVIALGMYRWAAFRVCGKAAKHTLFATAMLLFVLYGGQNWHHYATALMVAAWVRYKGDLTARL